MRFNQHLGNGDAGILVASVVLSLFAAASHAGPTPLDGVALAQRFRPAARAQVQSEGGQGQSGQGQFSQGETGQGQFSQGETSQGQFSQGQSQVSEGQSKQGQLGEGQFSQGQLSEGQSKQGQLSEGQFSQGQLSEGQSKQGQLSEGQFTQGQLSEGQSKQGQLSEGQFSQGQLNEGQSKQGQLTEGQSKQGQLSEGQFSQGQLSEGQSKQGQFSQGQVSEGQSKQGQFSQGQLTEGQSREGQFGQGQVSQGQLEQPQSLANFGDVVVVQGDMQRTDQDFRDGFAIDMFSPKSRTIVVTQNNEPLDGSFVRGTTGEPFVALSSYSYVLRVNEPAHDLVAKVELPYDTQMLQRMGISEANLYVGTLTPDKKSWAISEGQRNVHVSEGKVRIIKMTSLDGEYILLGRQSQDTGNIFVQYGQGQTRTVNYAGGRGTREAEFVDGMRIAIESDANLQLNAELRGGNDRANLPSGGYQFLNSYAWVINSTRRNTNDRVVAEIRFPVNSNMLESMTRESNAWDRVVVARRDSRATGSYVVLDERSVSRQPDVIRIQLADEGRETRLDGQYVLLVSNNKVESNNERPSGEGSRPALQLSAGLPGLQLTGSSPSLDASGGSSNLQVTGKSATNGAGAGASSSAILVIAAVAAAVCVF